MRSRRAKNPKNLEVEEIAHLKIHEETISYQDFGNGHGDIVTRITNPKGITPNRNLNTSLKFRGRTPASHNSHYWGGEILTGKIVIVRTLFIGVNVYQKIFTEPRTHFI